MPFESHQKAVAAQEAGRFKAEIVPVEVKGRKGENLTVEADEGPRKDTSLESLAKLKPSFKTRWQGHGWQCLQHERRGGRGRDRLATLHARNAA